MRKFQGFVGCLLLVLPLAASAQELPEADDSAPDAVDETSADPLAAEPMAEEPATDTAPAPEEVAPVADEGGGDMWGDAGGGDAWGDAGGDALPETTVNMYGYIDAYVEKVAKTPGGVDGSGNTTYDRNPHEFDVPNLNLMMMASHGDRFRGFLNLAAPGAESIEVRNAWVEASIYKQYLKVRAGKMYRPFGLYNEMLDAVPTYMGIEPPELFDGDHLMLTRTTNFMIRGSHNSGTNTITYSFTTGNDERADNALPIGGDINFDYDSRYKIGTSFYFSGGDAAPSKGVGEGSPDGAVLPWMERDKFAVYGAYAQLLFGDLKLQSEFWIADHNATRDAASVALLEEAGLNSRQLARFGLDGDPSTVDNVDTNGDYQVVTFYVRSGYTILTDSWGSFTPYAQYDFYRNEETIAAKKFGGDNEAGLSDDGLFHKATLGSVWRPITEAAIKLDASTHTQKFNGEMITYPEIRLSFSYLWNLN